MGKGAKAPTTNPFPLNFAKPLWRFAPMGVLCILHKSGRAGCGQRNRNFHYTMPPQICQAFFVK
jgi:hypothetical protein